MEPRDQGWGSCPIQGCDWGTSQTTEHTVIQDLMRKLDQSRYDAGNLRSLFTCTTSSAHVLTAGSSMLHTSGFYNDEDDQKNSGSSIGLDFEAAYNFSLGNKMDSGSILQEETSAFGQKSFSDRNARRRQMSMAKHKRMSLLQKIHITWLQPQ